jgi:hypothetical protein
MKLQIRTKDNLVELLKKGISHAWKVNKGRLNSITEVEIYDFSGKAKISGRFDRENSQILENGRIAVAFKDAKIEQTDFKWVGQNPIKYKTVTNETVELMEDEVEETQKNDDWNIDEVVNRDFFVNGCEGFCGRQLLLKTSFKPVKDFDEIVLYINKLFSDSEVDVLFWYKDYRHFDGTIILYANTYLLSFGSVFEKSLYKYGEQEIESFLDTTGINQHVKSLIMYFWKQESSTVSEVIENLLMKQGQTAEVEITDMLYGNSSFEISK